MNRPIHFEMHSSNPEKTIAFFKEVFGWQTQKWDGPMEYWLVTTGKEGEPGISGGFLRSRDGQPRTVNTVDVASVEKTSEAVVKAGGQVVVPTMAIPGVGWLAYAVDPTGNLIGYMEHDENAK